MVVGGKGKGKPVRGQKPTRGGPKQFTNTTELSRQTDEINNNWKHRDQKESSSEDEEEEEKVPIIEVNNPNAPKKNIKLGDLSSGAGEKVELSRREREVIEKERAKEAYMKKTMEGKTDQARSDLARLAIIKKNREEAAVRKAAEVEAKAEDNAQKQETATANKGKTLNAYGF